MASADGSLKGASSKPVDLLVAAREYEPLIPAAVVDYHLRKAGCIMSEPDLVAVVGLAAQKLACDIVTETRARWYGRQNAEKRRRAHTDDGFDKKPKMTSKDLEGSLNKIGVSTDVPPYFIAHPAPKQT